MPVQGPCLAAAAVVTASALGGAYCAYRAYLRTRIPTEWVQVGTLKELNVYPIKSCGRVTLEEAEVTLLGVKDGWLRDRVLMVVDEKNNFITARVYPELLVIHAMVRNAILTLTYEEFEPLHVNLAEVAALQKSEIATVWGDEVPVWDCGREASEWFCKLLNKPMHTYRLMYYATEKSRPLKPSNINSHFYKINQKDTGAFPDEVAYHLINKASVDDLEKRLVNSSASTRNFRANFVVEGPAAYDEDNWKYLKIGDQVFKVLKSCGRCLLTTIDPETGLRDPNTEPLETLKSYRQHEDPVERKAAGPSPRMGVLMALLSPPGGRVRVNDPVYVA